MKSSFDSGSSYVEIRNISLWMVVVAFLMIGFMLVATDKSYGMAGAVGWIAVIGASTIFGAVGVPMKAPPHTTNHDQALLLSTAEEKDSLIFALYSSFGIILVNLPALFYLLIEDQFIFIPWAILGSVDILFIVCLASIAVRELGYAKAPAVWCSVGMLSSFGIGAFVFQEPIQYLYMEVLAVLLLVAGVVAVNCCNSAISQNIGTTASDTFNHDSIKTDVPSKEDVSRVEMITSSSAQSLLHKNHTIGCGMLDIEPAVAATGTSGTSSPVTTGPMQRNYAYGILLCVLMGCCDGALMVPFKLSRAKTIHDTLNYMASFGIGSMIAAPIVFVCYYAYIRCVDQHDQQSCAAAAAGDDGDVVVLGEYGVHECRALTRSELFLNQLRSNMLLGIIMGMLWASANFMGVYATFYLGMKVGFPLTQTCVVFAALWGIFYFREIDLYRNYNGLKFSFGLLTILLGSYLLATGGSWD